MFNKRQLYVGLILSLGISSVAFARGPMGPEQMEQFTSQHDLNQDGQVTQEEIQAARTAIFQQADTNGDSSLNLSELQTLMENKRAEHLAAKYASLDADGNGQVSVTEFQSGHPDGDTAAAATIFGLADTNGDNVLSTEEFATLKSPEGRLWHHFAELDTDGNGVVSVTEFTEAKPKSPKKGKEGKGHGDKGQPR